MKNLEEDRVCGIAFWWFYTVLAFLSLLSTENTEKSGHLPKWAHKRVSSLEYCQQALVSRWRWKIIRNSADTGTNISAATAPSEATGPKPCITTFALIRFLTQFVGVVVFCGSIVLQEASNAPDWGIMEVEEFAAVGQWSNLAVVVLVLLAGVIRRIWGGGGNESAVVEIGRLEQGEEKLDGVEDEDVEVEIRIGIGDLDMPRNLIESENGEPPL